MRKNTGQKRLRNSIMIVVVILVIAGILQALWGSYILNYYKKQNAQLEYTIARAFMTDKDISFSYLYLQLQQMIYDGAEFEELESAFEPDEADVFSQNNAIRKIKELFMELVNVYGNSMNFFYYNPEIDKMVYYGKSSIRDREEFIGAIQKEMKNGTVKCSGNGMWYLYQGKYICMVTRGLKGYVGCYMLTKDFTEQIVQMVSVGGVKVELYDRQNKITYVDERKASGERESYVLEGENEDGSYRSMNYADFGIRIQLEENNLTQPLVMQVVFTAVSVVFLICVVFVIQYTRKKILRQATGFYDNLMQFSEQMKFNEESGIVEFAEAGKVLNQLAEQINKLKIDVYEEQLEKKKVELDYAQLQIRPHFYINCLNVIYSLAQMGDMEQIQKISLHVSKYLRYIFNKSMEPVTVAEELQFVKNYLQVIDNVNGVDCKLEIEVEEGLEQFPVPPLMIQTFVENSVKHGMNIEELFSVSIAVTGQGSGMEACVRIVIEDSGRGIPAELREQWNRGIFETEDESQHVGVRNTAKRMKMLYGEKARLQFEEAADGGSRVIMYFPRTFAEK